MAAYGTLYANHVGAAYGLARRLTRSTADADDLVSEAFLKVLDAILAGGGPNSAFRAYLLTALRHVAYDQTRRNRKVELSGDIATVAGTIPFSDTAVAMLDESLVARAFDRLPERWQLVLWHTEIEGRSPRQTASQLGLTPNGVSALACRAREGLRQAYLQVHLADGNAPQRCRNTRDRLGAYARQGLSKRGRVLVEAHLGGCVQCREFADELGDIGGQIRA